MIPQERAVSESELHHNNGDDSSRKWIAFEGVVYDVTECPRWQKELHERMHFPGQDLTSELPDAPHMADVFTRPCVKVVGKLEES